MSQKRNSTSSGVASSSSRVLVTPAKGGWQVKRDGASRAAGLFATQAEATQAAKAKLRDKGGELRVQGRDGRWQDTFTLGEKAMTKVAAVEGIRFTSAMKRKMKALETPGLTAEERRRILKDPAASVRR